MGNCETISNKIWVTVAVDKVKCIINEQQSYALLITPFISSMYLL